MWDPANHDVGYALTNMHVVKPPDVTTITKNVSKIGQPEGNDSSSKCCNDVIGVFAGGADTPDRDEALVKLSPGQKWQAKIEEHRPRRRCAPAHPGRGHGGRVQGRQTGAHHQTHRRHDRRAVGPRTGTADNIIIVDPNPNTGADAGEIVFFAIEGDSGSALVNSANEVVGLV